MKLFSIATMVIISLIAAVPLARAASDQDTQTQIEALQAQLEAIQEQNQKQIESLQAQLETLKQQMTTQVQERQEEKLVAEARKAKLAELAKYRDSGIQGWVRRGEGFKLREEIGLEEEGILNITGEINMRYRENIHKEGSSYGFQFYELGLMLDAAVNDWTSAYAEYNLVHSTKAEAEDVWIDLHLPGEATAFAGGTGLKIGQFHAPFGWDNDDCEGFVYGGRTSVNAALMRYERIDGQRLRERQIGIQGNYNFDLGEDLELIFSAAALNGSGAMLSYGGSDNDRKKDYAFRLESRFLDTALGASYWHGPSTGGVTANTNNKAHVRAFDRYGVHFKYPVDVPFPGGDPSLGGEKFLLWGEAFYGIAEGNGIGEAENVTLSAFNETQKFWGAYVETDVSLIPDKLLGFLRLDYWEPNMDNGDNEIVGITPGIYITLWPGISVLTLEYEYYQGGTQDDNDRIAAELQIFF